MLCLTSKTILDVHCINTDIIPVFRITNHNIVGKSRNRALGLKNRVSDSGNLGVDEKLFYVYKRAVIQIVHFFVDAIVTGSFIY